MERNLTIRLLHFIIFSQQNSTSKRHLKQFIIIGPRNIKTKEIVKNKNINLTKFARKGKKGKRQKVYEGKREEDVEGRKDPIV